MKGKVEACDGKEEAEKFKASNNCGFKGSRSAITLFSGEGRTKKAAQQVMGGRQFNVSIGS